MIGEKQETKGVIFYFKIGQDDQKNVKIGRDAISP